MENNDEKQIDDDVYNGESVGDEEDCEIYFLQPASSPYNIKEKLEEANKALFAEIIKEEEERELKIKFREELVDYEPDSTDDDVQSFESYNEIDFSVIDKIETYPELECTRKLELNIFTPSLVSEENEEEEEAEDGEMEEVHEEMVEEGVEIEEEIPEENERESCNEEEVFESESVSQSSEIIYHEKPKFKPKRKRLKRVNIDCKSHCIERLPDVNLRFKNLEISPKHVCPVLKLMKRRCCEKNTVKIEQKLPVYAGLKSEYGLSSAQLERRRRRKELSKIREEKNKRLSEEYTRRRNEQNEEIFLQWLKEVDKRKELELKYKRKSKYWINIK